MGDARSHGMTGRFVNVFTIKSSIFKLLFAAVFIIAHYFVKISCYNYKNNTFQKINYLPQFIGRQGKICQVSLSCSCQR